MKDGVKKGPEVRRDLEDIFMAGVERVNPEAMILSRVRKEGNILKISLEDRELEYDLNNYKQIFVIGAGKATAPMASALERILGARISKGIISVKYGHTAELDMIKLIEAGHPVPDDNSLKAAGEILEMVSEADENTLVISLISGGGSSLLTFPLSSGGFSITFREKQETTKLLLECGATIQEINCVRKHISGIKGGRLAAALYPATCVNLVLSDVIGDRLDTIASGMTVPDGMTFSVMEEILDKYGIKDRIPESVRKALEMGLAGELPETPKEGDPVFGKIENCLLGTNRSALLASEKRARELGYKTIVLSSRICGEAREIAKFYLGMALDNGSVPAFSGGKGLADESGVPLCIMAGGETTVTIRGKGKGGRNQEMALSFLNELRSVEDEAEGIYFLSGGTDGNDGPTDAAGAYADIELLNAGNNEGLSVQEYLNNNDSYNYFSKIDGLLLTGPTNTNVCDMQIVIIG